VVSPPGRNLAYSVGWSSGVCHQESPVFVADLGANKATGPAAVAGVDAASPSMLAEPGESLVFRESKFEGDDSCKRHPWQTKNGSHLISSFPMIYSGLSQLGHRGADKRPRRAIISTYFGSNQWR
jgi:hypothetical protein